MKCSNAQIKVVLPLLIREAKSNPNVELGAFIDNMVQLAIARGLRDFLMGMDLSRPDPPPRKTNQNAGPYGIKESIQREPQGKIKSHPLLGSTRAQRPTPQIPDPVVSHDYVEKGVGSGSSAKPAES